MRIPPFSNLFPGRWMRSTAMVLVVLAALVATGRAQAAANSKPSAPAPSAVSAPQPSANPNAPAAAMASSFGQGYSYDPAGRRDPFVSLVNRGSDAGATAASRPEGVAGVGVDEVALRGIVQSRGSYAAMIQAPDGRNYTVRAGDKLLDGVVKAVTSSAVVFVQQVSDPLSLVKQREIRKPLRPTEEGK